MYDRQREILFTHIALQAIFQDRSICLIDSFGSYSDAREFYAIGSFRGKSPMLYFLLVPRASERAYNVPKTTKIREYKLRPPIWMTILNKKLAYKGHVIMKSTHEIFFPPATD